MGGPVRAWQFADGFVVDLGPTREAVVTTLTEQISAAPWRDLREFAILDARGGLARRCRVLPWSLDDELGVEVYGIVGDELRSLRVSVWTGATWRFTRDESVLAAGLKGIAGDTFRSLRVE